MLVNSEKDGLFLIGGKFRPRYFNLFHTIFLNPYFGNSLTPMGSFAPGAHNMNVTPVFGCISREDREYEAQNE